MTGGTRHLADRSRPEGDDPVRPCRTRSARRVWAAVTVLVFDDLAQNILLPVLPYYHHHLHLTAGQLGVVLAAEPAMVLVASPLLGHWLQDRPGWHRPALGFGLALFAGATASYGLASAWAVLVLVRLVHGLAVGATFPPAFASVAGLAAGRDRIRLLTLVNTVAGLGALATPAVSGLLVSGLHLPWAFVVVAGAMLVTLPVLVAILGASPALSASTRKQETASAGLGPQVVALLAACLAMAEIGVVEVVMPLVTSARLGFGPAVIGAYLLAVGLGFAAPQPVIPAMGRRWGSSRVLGAGAILAAAVMGAAMTSPPWLLAVLVGVLGFPLSALFATAIALAGEDPRSAGSFGRMEGAIALGLLLGSVGGGAVLGHAGYKAALGVGAGITALAAWPLARWSGLGGDPG